jgi:hypothetical protein
VASTLSSGTRCKICGGSAPSFGRATVLGRHDVEYFQCSQCGFTQSESPHWLSEAYSEAITRSDVGLIWRNLYFAPLTRAVINSFFDPSGRFVDYGGGYGVFVRLMRDAGYDFYREDRYCENLFAQDLDAEPSGNGRYELLTAFEVFEHLVDPLTDIERMFTYSPSVLFSTALIPPANPRPGEWWYYGTEHGQHVGLYTARALQSLAQRFKVNLYSNDSLHLLTPRRISARRFRYVTTPWVAALLARLRSRPSLLAADFARASGQSLN